MSIVTFRNDDGGYLAWLAANPTGWVVNTTRTPSAGYVKLHRAGCPSISAPQRTRWTTGDYAKVCAPERRALDEWAAGELGGPLQTGCACVQHGGSPVAPAAPAARHEPGTGFRGVDAPGLVPFEPREQWAFEVRAELRRIVEALHARPGQLLHGVVEGPSSRTDLDNALLYNVGGRVGGGTRYGVLLERRSGPTVRYRYRLTGEAGLGSHAEGVLVAEFEHVRLARAPRTWLDVWAAMTTCSTLRVGESSLAGDLTLSVRVGAPAFSGSANGAFVKLVVDGILSSLHAHGDRATTDEISRRMARQGTLSAGEIAALLVREERAVLGVRPQLIVLRGGGVQCRPDDHRVCALRIELDRSATAWTLAGRVAVATAT
jgi:hypothetical protein